MNVTTGLLILSTAALSVAAAQPDLSKLPAPAQQTGVTYEKDIRPLFEKSCFGCHGERRQRGDLRLDSLADVLKGSEHGKVIVPGKSAESVLVIAVAQIDDETAMPPKRQGRGGSGNFGGGELGRTQLSQQLIAKADQNKDDKATEKEWAQMSESLYKKLDADHSGGVTQTQFAERLPTALAAESTSANPRKFAPYVSAGFFTNADADKDGKLTAAEFNGTLKKWHADFAKESGGDLSQEALYAGLREVMPQGAGAGARPSGQSQPPRNAGNQASGRGPRNNAAGGGGGGNNGPQPQPLTKEQVALVRAWVDQGAK